MVWLSREIDFIVIAAHEYDWERGTLLREVERQVKSGTLANLNIDDEADRFCRLRGIKKCVGRRVQLRDDRRLPPEHLASSAWRHPLTDLLLNMEEVSIAGHSPLLHFRGPRFTNPRD